MPKIHRTTPAAWLASLLIVPALLADCSGSSSTADATAGSSSAGSSSAGSSNIGGGGDATSATCATSECGPALGLANYQCPDGSVGGPTGRCLKGDNGTCGWEIRSCPTGSVGTGGGASAAAGAGAGAGGQASGGAAGQLCGGRACGADQICCGPASCGRCLSKFSGQACPALCPGGSGGSGGTGSGGAGGGASGGASAAECSSLLTEVQSTLAEAQGCNTASLKPELECAGTLEGVCCPVLVESTDSNSAKNNAYLSALHAYQRSCSHACLKIACLKPQMGNCVAPPGSSLGTCGGGTGL